MPDIQGPAAAARGGPAPAFQVDPDPGRFYAVELTTHWQWFADQGETAPPADQFFGSWSAGPLSNAPAFQVPAEVWQRLSAADRLYYRVVTSSTAGGWVDAETSTPADMARSAPTIQIVSLAAGEVLEPAQVPLVPIWEHARQQGSIRPLLEGKGPRVAVILHLSSPRRPLDPRSVEWVVVASREIAGGAMETGLVRLDGGAQAVRGEWSGRDPLAAVDAAAAWARIQEPSWASGPAQMGRLGDNWVLSALRPPPTRMGGTAIVGAHTGRLLYKATTEWEGGRVLVPA